MFTVIANATPNVSPVDQFSEEHLVKETHDKTGEGHAQEIVRPVANFVNTDGMTILDQC
jgi:hypothetical protein